MKIAIILYKKKNKSEHQFSYFCRSPINPLIPNINMHLLLTVLHTILYGTG